MRHEGRCRDYGVSRNRDSYRSCLHRIVRLRFHFFHARCAHPIRFQQISRTHKQSRKSETLDVVINMRPNGVRCVEKGIATSLNALLFSRAFAVRKCFAASAESIAVAKSEAPIELSISVFIILPNAQTEPCGCLAQKMPSRSEEIALSVTSNRIGSSALLGSFF